MGALIMTRNDQARRWTFTLNNYNCWDEANLEELDCKYLVYGREVGESGTPHLQGYVEFERKKRFGAVKSLISSSCHLEKSKGSGSENRSYCIKDGDFFEKGVMGSVDKPEVGALISLAKSGKFDEIEEQDPFKFLQYYRTFRLIHKDYQQRVQNLDGVCGLWIYGPPGTGKSHCARATDPYLKNLNKWWDGYQDEDNVLLEEINPECSPWIAPYLKLWGDKWPFTAEVKGSSRMIRPKKFIVTSNYSIAQMGFSMADELAIRRRFVEVEKLTRDQSIMI